MGLEASPPSGYPFCAGHDCYQFEQNGHMVLSCNMRRDSYRLNSLLDLSLNVQFVQAVESRVSRLGQKAAAAAAARNPGPSGEECQNA